MENGIGKGSIMATKLQPGKIKMFWAAIVKKIVKFS